MESQVKAELADDCAGKETRGVKTWQVQVQVVSIFFIQRIVNVITF